MGLFAGWGIRVVSLGCLFGVGLLIGSGGYDWDDWDSGIFIWGKGY